MKNNTIINRTIACAAGLVLSAATTQAALYHVSIDTAALLLSPASNGAPFSLDFQFNDGGTLGNNTAVINNFNFGGGLATGTPVTFGGVEGDLSSSITFDDSAFFSELYQTFTPGATLSFDVNISENSDGPTPDSFVVSILDAELINIPTSGFGNSLFQVGNDNPGAVTLGTGTGDYSGVVAVPEPSASLLGVFACGLGLLRRRRAA
jgi:hypothetical protein